MITITGSFTNEKGRGSSIRAKRDNYAFGLIAYATDNSFSLKLEEGYTWYLTVKVGTATTSLEVTEDTDVSDTLTELEESLSDD